jgi:hypothetical protein
MHNDQDRPQLHVASTCSKSSTCRPFLRCSARLPSSRYGGRRELAPADDEGPVRRAPLALGAAVLARPHVGPWRRVRSDRLR